MLEKLLLIRLCVVAWVLFCGVFLGVAETIVGSPVRSVMLVLFCGMFLGVVETIVGSPVC